MTKTSVQVITQSEYQQLLGLKLLADRHTAALTDILLAVRDITGEEDDFGHSGDALYDPATSVDDLLRKLKIEVSRP